MVTYRARLCARVLTINGPYDTCNRTPMPLLGGGNGLFGHHNKPLATPPHTGDTDAALGRTRHT